MGLRKIIGLLFLIQCVGGCLVWTGDGVGWWAGIMSGHSENSRVKRGWRRGFGTGELGCHLVGSLAWHWGMELSIAIPES